MADMGIIDLEPMRNFDWKPTAPVVPGVAAITDRHANRSHTRRKRVDAMVLYPGSEGLRKALEQDEPFGNSLSELHDL